MMVKSGLEFILEIDRAPSKIPANLPGQFSPTGQIFLHWAAATLKAKNDQKWLYNCHLSVSFISDQRVFTKRLERAK